MQINCHVVRLGTLAWSALLSSPAGARPGAPPRAGRPARPLL